MANSANMKISGKRTGFLFLVIFVLVILIYWMNGCGTPKSIKSVELPKPSPSAKPVSPVKKAPKPIHTPTPAPNPAPIPQKVPSVGDSTRPSVHFELAPRPIESSTPAPVSAQSEIADSTANPLYIVTLNEEDSKLFYRHFSKQFGIQNTTLQMVPQSNSPQWVRSFDLTSQNHSFEMHCNQLTVSGAHEQYQCTLQFFVSRTNDQTQIFYNSANGAIRAVFHNPKDLSLFTSALETSPEERKELVSEEDILVTQPTGLRTVVARAKIDCDNSRDSFCRINAIRDFQNPLETR